MKFSSQGYIQLETNVHVSSAKVTASSYKMEPQEI